MPTKTLSTTAKLYVSSVIVAGALAVLSSVFDLVSGAIDSRWLFLAALTIFSGSATVRLPSIPASLSVSETFVFTSVLLFGAPAGTLTVALDGLIISLWLSKRRKEAYRVLFNMAAPSLSIWIAAQLFFVQAHIDPLSVSKTTIVLSAILPSLVVFTINYFLLNSWLIAIAVSLETGESAFAIWRTNFAWLSLNFFCGAAVAALIAGRPARSDMVGWDYTNLWAIVPVLLVLYLTYRTSMARVEDATQHLVRMNEMYISTIETLAMAIDAKDQITHGHIRRVQSYATALADSLHIEDPGLLQAIQAASLLHDMGKLAVPEHILNKPGRLTKIEFERMKTHAGIGADILSSIQFPYPVIPIVRHHHENWDGTGYPHGLRGTEIPIGARILSVVDCFDALTSDRPYRRKLSDEEAIDILLERRGRMYDPLVVDRFIEIVRRTASFVTPSPVEAQTAAAELTKAIAANALARPVAPSASIDSAESQDLFRLCRSVSSHLFRNTPDALAAAMKSVTTAVQSDLALVFVHNAKAECLVPAYFSRPVEPTFAEFAIPVGQRLSGWVGANRVSVLNANPALDYGEVHATHLDAFRCVLSVPLALGDVLVGVLCLYSASPDHFTAKDQQVCEVVSAHLALVLAGHQVQNTSSAWDAA
jgi:putative nucleotidyltransferase with HDIG domain